MLARLPVPIILREENTVKRSVPENVEIQIGVTGKLNFLWNFLLAGVRTEGFQPAAPACCFPESANNCCGVDQAARRALGKGDMACARAVRVRA